MINIKKKRRILNLRTDFADEVIIGKERNDVYAIKNSKYGEINVAEVEIFKKERSLNKDPGLYISIEFDDITDKKEKNEVSEVLTHSLKKIINYSVSNKKLKILIVGLGNKEIKADSLGPIVASQILVTNHLFVHAPEILTEGSSPVAVVAPGVMGQTGLETSDIISSIVKVYQPSVIIAVDALATRNIQRINKVIQITDTGISPGSGVGNYRKALNYRNLKTPVIAIGVATVVDAASIVNETIELINKSGKAKITLANREDLISDILHETGYNYIVTPKEIDEEIRNISFIISEAINSALHQNYHKM